jgi:hypothetical protein
MDILFRCGPDTVFFLSVTVERPGWTLKILSYKVGVANLKTGDLEYFNLQVFFYFKAPTI